VQFPSSREVATRVRELSELVKSKIRANAVATVSGNRQGFLHERCRDFWLSSLDNSKAGESMRENNGRVRLTSDRQALLQVSSAALGITLRIGKPATFVVRSGSSLAVADGLIYQGLFQPESPFSTQALQEPKEP
jgi:hypothetical protein